MSVSIEKVRLADIHEYDGNPRQISKKDFDVLKQSLKDFPEMLDVREIVVDEVGTILGGNQRYKALLANGVAETTVKRVTGWSEDKKREFVIKDNIANGDWDMDKLANEWDADKLMEWGMFDVKHGIKDEKDIENNPPSIVSSFLTFDYNDEIQLFIEDDTAVNLMAELLEYKEKHGSYNGFWDERLKR